MKKVILIDGNNLMFRSYYATLYSGSMMTNKEGFPTNALFGFVNMINKIINEESPEYLMVAFDMGKTFRHEKYDYYKGKRDETPDDLKKQFPIAKKILTAMGIKYFEIEGYEADDIIGTFAKDVDNSQDFTGVIVSSDKDLLQLISDKVVVKLLKPKDYIWMNKETFFETYGLEPRKMVDLKSLMGDASDNIPGVKGIGEKTALKLLQEYGSLDLVYENIDKIKGSVHDKLVNDKDNAYMSYDVATIYREVPIEHDLNNLGFNQEDSDELIQLYSDLEFHSFLRKKNTNGNVKNECKYTIIDNTDNIKLGENVAVDLLLDNDNYHLANIIGLSLYDGECAYYIDGDNVKNLDFLSGKKIYTYNYKAMYSICKRLGIGETECYFDTMLAGYLLNYNVKDDIAYLANSMNYEIKIFDRKEEISREELIKRRIMASKFILDSYKELLDKLKDNEMDKLFYEVEMPLSRVLADMELNGVRVDKTVLEDMKEEISKQIEVVSQDVYDLVGHEFNIGSPKQLGVVLFEEMNLPYGKKNKTGYVTDANILGKLIEYPVVRKILEYRMLTKLYTTYLEGVLSTVSSDGKIHTIYTQALTRTGRLSSIEPNLQNIPVRNELGRLIRRGFVAEDNSIMMSSDYSQIELRMFAHLSGVGELSEAFNNGMDIHTKTAMDIFKVRMEEVTKNMRRQAKAVNFGILYGISPYGLAEDLGISPKEAKMFIEKYFETYPGIKEYMNKEIEVAHKNGFVKTIMGRKREIQELSSSNYMQRSMGERMALNTPVQGSSADILKMAMIEIDNEIRSRKLMSTMLLQVHDELIFNVLESEKDEMEQLVRNIMENIYKLSVPLEVDIQFGKNWYEAK